jgi:hypothetical protein
MLRWFLPRCPVTSREKAWIERRMAWLAASFGLDRLRYGEVIEPTPKFFPDPYAGQKADVRNMLDRVCVYMDVSSDRVDLDFFKDGAEGIHDAAGLYVAGPRQRIRINESQLSDPLALVATLSHELAHVLLLGDGRISVEEWDHEWLTDLLTVFLGLGIFRSNSVIRESNTTEGLWHIWRMRRQGYLSERMYGYALAVFAWARGERGQGWAGHLRPNVRLPFEDGRRYLARTGDCLFQPDQPADSTDDKGRLDRLLDRLQSRYSGVRIAALWDLQDLGLEARPAEPALIRALRDDDVFVRAEAARTLGQFGHAAQGSVPALVEAALIQDEAEVRTDAVQALAEIGQRPEEVVPALMALLAEEEVSIRIAVIRALRAFGAASAEAVPALTQSLFQSEEVADEVLQTLAALGPVAAAAIPALQELLDSEDAGVLHRRARLTLEAIGRTG